MPEPNEPQHLRHALYRWAGDDVGLIALERFGWKLPDVAAVVSDAGLDRAMLRWVVVRTHRLKAEGTERLTGQHTHGVGRFDSSLAGRPMSSLSLLTVSLIDVAARRAYPLPVAQHLPKAHYRAQR